MDQSINQLTWYGNLLHAYNEVAFPFSGGRAVLTLGEGVFSKTEFELLIIQVVLTSPGGCL